MTKVRCPRFSRVPSSSKKVDWQDRCSRSVAPFLRQLKEGALAHVAAYGIGFLHEGLGAEEQAAVLALHAAGGSRKNIE